MPNTITIFPVCASYHPLALRFLLLKASLPGTSSMLSTTCITSDNPNFCAHSSANSCALRHCLSAYSLACFCRSAVRSAAVVPAALAAGVSVPSRCMVSETSRKRTSSSSSASSSDSSVSLMSVAASTSASISAYFFSFSSSSFFISSEYSSKRSCACSSSFLNSNGLP